MAKFIIPAIVKNELQKKLEKLSKKAKTYGNQISWSFGEEVAVSRNLYSVNPDTHTLVKTGEDKVFGIEVNIESDVIRKEGYTVVAQIETVGHEQNIVKMLDGESPAELAWYTMPLYCEHCHGRHVKRFSFIVKDESGQYKQVGKTCLKDFCGIDPKMIIAAQEIHDLIENDYNIDEYDFKGSGENAFDVLKAIATANDIIKEHGYVKSCEDNSTKTRLFIEIGKSEPSEESLKLANEMKEVLTAAEYDELSDFLCNVKSMIQGGYIRSNAFGYIAYAPVAYKQMKEKQEREILNNEAKANSNYIGNIGEKITADIKEAKLITEFVTRFGVGRLYKFTTTDNNTLVWFASKYYEGAPKQITGTVKDHKEYNGEKQTVLTRCKMILG